jgi:hypothetical protein
MSLCTCSCERKVSGDSSTGGWLQGTVWSNRCAGGMEMGTTRINNSMWRP